jgi:glycogen debranching enzyme
MIYQDLVEKCNLKANQYDGLAERVRASFEKHFYNGVYLHDVVGANGETDNAIRPNQIYAISLPYALLTHEKAGTVLDTVASHLVTPLGLRSLSPEHPDFIGTYGGDVWSRDSAYHQGTVWSFLIGEYWLAWLKHNDYASGAKHQVAEWMIPLIEHFYNEDCIRGINEIFDGLDPKEGRGCVHQAWSVGMMIKVIYEIGRDY